MPPGPIPLPDHERQRRNDSAKFRPLTDGVPAPRAVGYLDWTSVAQTYWRDVKRSKAARSYDHADWRIALRAAQLVDDAEQLRSEREFVKAKSILAEVRQLEDRLLLNVRSRRAARIAEADDARRSEKAASASSNYRKIVENG